MAIVRRSTGLILALMGVYWAPQAREQEINRDR